MKSKTERPPTEWHLPGARVVRHGEPGDGFRHYDLFIEGQPRRGVRFSTLDLALTHWEKITNLQGLGSLDDLWAAGEPTC